MQRCLTWPVLGRRNKLVSDIVEWPMTYRTGLEVGSALMEERREAEC